MSVEGSDRRDVHILVGLLVNWFEADNTIAQPPNSMVRGHTSQRAPPAELMVIWLKESIKSILDSQTHHSEDRVHKKAPNSSKSTDTDLHETNEMKNIIDLLRSEKGNLPGAPSGQGVLEQVPKATSVSVNLIAVTFHVEDKCGVREDS
ncbi:hypothetical protein IFM89_016073 [Coptis chinensis]|uniref:Uncharacterized protein n=1 Tax=Coptis chinensis TaxID=261450 RepID=A0A835LZN6_9MAGN|nr:hypothetical protein IFM89_016073 [Coptis chinensis]